MPDDYSNPAAERYPARLAIDYPEDGLNRLTTLFRLFLAIPIGLLVVLLGGDATTWQEEDVEVWVRVPQAVGVLFLPVLFMILFRRTGTWSSPGS